MFGGITGIDHLVLGVHSLADARDRWRRLGFTLSPRGRHIGQQTANYCVMFADAYIELLGGVAETRAAEVEAMPALGSFPPAREGPMAAALAPSGSAAEARARLLARGLHPTEPRFLGRHIELTEDAAPLRFALVSLPPEETPGLECFLCEQLTPELLRQPEWLAHPNGAIGLGGIYVLVDSTSALPPAYDRLFGMHAVTTTDAVVSVDAGRHRIVFSTPDDFTTMHPSLAGGDDLPRPAIAAIEFAVTDATATAQFLTDQRLAWVGLADGSLALPASAANGAILFFAEG